MTTPSRSSDDVRAVDVEISENDLPGLAVDLTTDDIDDIAMDAGVPVAERRWKLMQLRDELAARQSADFNGRHGGVVGPYRRPAGGAGPSAGKRCGAGLDRHERGGSQRRRRPGRSCGRRVDGRGLRDAGLPPLAAGGAPFPVRRPCEPSNPSTWAVSDHAANVTGASCRGSPYFLRFFFDDPLAGSTSKVICRLTR